MVNLPESTISENLTISRLDCEIKTEVLKSQSNDWTQSKLLTLAKIKDHDARKTKFEDLKAKIDKKSKSHDKDSDNPEVNSDADQSSICSADDKKVSRLIARSSAYIKHLRNSKRLKLNDSEKAEIRRHFDEIQKLIDAMLT